MALFSENEGVTNLIDPAHDFSIAVWQVTKCLMALNNIHLVTIL